MAFTPADAAAFRPSPIPAVTAASFVTAPAIINLSEARARAFHNWRDKNNEVLERRERERRASRYLRA